MTALQRGLITHLIRRGQAVEREVIGAILGIETPAVEQFLPEYLEVQGPQAWEDLGKVLPQSLCKSILTPKALVKIKLEP